MTRITLLLILTAFYGKLTAQESGITAGLKYARYFELPRQITGAPDAFTGVNGEWVLRRHINDFRYRLGAGADLFFPGKDTLMTGGYSNSVYQMFRVDIKTNITNIYFRGGFEIKQANNPNASFYTGAGLGIRKINVTRTIAGFNKATDELIDDRAVDSYLDWFGTLAFYLGGFYELRHFTLWGQCDFIYTGSPALAGSAGIYVPVTIKEE